jgi:hypothetical protein
VADLHVLLAGEPAVGRVGADPLGLAAVLAREQRLDPGVRVDQVEREGPVAGGAVGAARVKDALLDEDRVALGASNSSS